MSPQIKSRERVRTSGEVFTAPKEVNAMLDLIQPQVADFSKRIMEPACGNGNFLVAIVNRRLALLPLEWSDENLLAIIYSIYGVDIAKDNVLEARGRMLNAIAQHIGKESYRRMRSDLKYVVERNIIVGDFLKYEETVKPKLRAW